VAHALGRREAEHLDVDACPERRQSAGEEPRDAERQPRAARGESIATRALGRG